LITKKVNFNIKEEGSIIQASYKGEKWPYKKREEKSVIYAINLVRAKIGPQLNC
jgi:hypothetical protein